MQRIGYLAACAALCLSAAGNADVGSPASRKVQLSKVVINPDIPKESQRVKVGTICLFSGSPLNFGTGERTANYERFERLFSTNMTKAGFNVVAKSSNLFDGEDEALKPDVLIGATFKPVSVDICDSVDGQKGTVKISVEWQIYDRVARKVVETATTEGIGQIPKFDPEGLSKMIDTAFVAALTTAMDQGVMQKHLGKPDPAK